MGFSCGRSFSVRSAGASRGNFQAAGNGGMAGSIGFAAMGGFLRSGYAAAGTDTGHEGMTGEFIIGHPEKLKDYAHRAFHEMTVTSKAVIAAYYGNGPKLSVLNNSGGGGSSIPGPASRRLAYVAMRQAQPT